MRKSEVLNTFAQGLVMDINPPVAPNDGVECYINYNEW